MAHEPVAVVVRSLHGDGADDKVAPSQGETLPPGGDTRNAIGWPARESSVGRDGREGASLALLVSRARIALWTVIASNAFFAVTDLRLGHDALSRVLGLKLLQVVAVALGLGALRSARSRAAVVAIVLVAAACVSGLTAWSGAVADDVVTTMILWLAVPFGTAALLPWGAWAQFGLVVIAGLAMLLNVALARGTLALALGLPSVGVLVTLGISVVLAREFERQRRVLMLENLRRERAEEDLRQANDSLEQRVQERTKALEYANTRLQEARDAAQAAEHRFRTVSMLTSDYAYCFRVEPDRPAVVEWLTEPSFERVTGYSTTEVAALGGGLGLVHPDDMAVAARRIEVLLAGRPDVSEFRIIRKDRSVRWIREHGYAEWDPAHARVVRIFGAAQDVTERRQAEERLAEALRQRENVMNTVPDIIYTLDCQGRLQDWNRRLERVTGRSAAALAGLSALEVFAAADRGRVAATIEHLGDGLRRGRRPYRDAGR
jgi:PAS domain S-box-containing protein